MLEINNNNNNNNNNKKFHHANKIIIKLHDYFISITLYI